MDLLLRFSTAEWIAMSSAALAAGIAIWSGCTSRRALKIALRQESRQQVPLQLYLADAYIRRVRAERRSIYVFHVVITNPADLQNSLRTIDLEVRYLRNGSPGPLVAVPHNPEAISSLTESPSILGIPASIAARSVVAGVATFSVPDELLGGADIESYRVSVGDALGRVTDLEAIFLREREDAE